MRTPYLFVVIFAAIVALVPGNAFGQPQAGDEGIIAQGRGPVHEGYAQPYNVQPQPGPAVPRQPPNPIPEEPPDQRPEGEGVQWIPGYWAWDGDRQDFLWVSGFWRVPPPERHWVPGHWAQAQDGWRWVPGWWAPVDQPEIPYLDTPPPATLDAGPSVPAPNENSFYVPGTWVIRNDAYAWRAGFWDACHPGWVWTPAQYFWTPSGYVFVNGYWDRRLEDRGLLYAPVSFARPFWNQPGWSYRPNLAVTVGGLFNSLFARPGGGHYYFGDYFDPSYARQGYQPWYGTRGNDPLFSYYRWQNRDNPGWYSGLRNSYQARVDGTLPRPARTFQEQRRVIQGGQLPAQVRANINLVQTVSPVTEVKNIQITRVNGVQQQQHRDAARQMRELQAHRTRVERPAAGLKESKAAQQKPTVVNRIEIPHDSRPRQARPIEPVQKPQHPDRSRIREGEIRDHRPAESAPHRPQPRPASKPHPHPQPKTGTIGA